MSNMNKKLPLFYGWDKPKWKCKNFAACHVYFHDENTYKLSLEHFVGLCVKCWQKRKDEQKKIQDLIDKKKFKANLFKQKKKQSN